ncbi:MAG TPA: hypothetical protein VMK12_11010 [Anaeromyxobacteraceae bacterium]|nr:hypothetical protein [Anaeromyxobacteraceae bacterium]
MNNAIYFDAALSDEERRSGLYEGQIYVYTPRPSAAAFAAFARGLIEEAFAPLDPRTAQHRLEVDRYAQILGRLKPAFIHHPESKRLVRALLADLGCDLDKTYFDVPRMRSSTSSGYLTTGIAYAWHPHRDTWYSAPPCQLNWWLPIYEISSDNAMAFHPRYFTQGLGNSSADYNYYVWNQVHRGSHVAEYTKTDPRPLPRATEPVEIDPQIRLIVPVGGLILFSAAQMHSSVPNTSGVTRFSIDFRTVHLDDVTGRRGARNVDSHCTGTTLRDYLRATDLAPLPEDLVHLYDDGTGDQGTLLYQPPEPAASKRPGTSPGDARGLDHKTG